MWENAPRLIVFHMLILEKVKHQIKQAERQFKVKITKNSKHNSKNSMRV